MSVRDGAIVGADRVALFAILFQLLRQGWWEDWLWVAIQGGFGLGSFVSCSCVSQGEIRQGRE